MSFRFLWWICLFMLDAKCHGVLWCKVIEAQQWLWVLHSILHTILPYWPDSFFFVICRARHDTGCLSCLYSFSPWNEAFNLVTLGSWHTGWEVAAALNCEWASIKEFILSECLFYIINERWRGGEREYGPRHFSSILEAFDLSVAPRCEGKDWNKKKIAEASGWYVALALPPQSK